MNTLTKIKQINLKQIFINLSLIFLLFIFLNSFFNIYALIIGIPLILLLNYLSNKEISKFPLKLFIIMFILRILIIIMFDTPVISDFATILNAAQNLLNKKNILNTSTYFYNYAYQTGPVIYTYLLLKIFNSVWFLKIINCVLSSLNCVLIYFLCLKFTSQKSAQKASLFYGFLMFPLLFNTVLSNQIPGSTLFYLALLILLNNPKSLKNYLICGILLSLGNLIRTEGIIFLGAIIGLYLFYIITKKATINNHKGIIILILTYFILGFSYNTLIKITHLNNEGLNNNTPSWKFILGFNTKTCGTYNTNDFIYMKDEKTAQKEILIRIKSLTPRTTLELISCKSNIMWRGGTLEWTFANLKDKEYHILGLTLNNKSLEDILTSLNKLIYYYIFIIMLIGLYKYQKDKNQNINVLLFINILALNFIAYSLIEVQPRYTYLFQISIFILSSLGFEALEKRKLK